MLIGSLGVCVYGDDETSHFRRAHARTTLLINFRARMFGVVSADYQIVSMLVSVRVRLAISQVATRGPEIYRPYTVLR